MSEAKLTEAPVFGNLRRAGTRGAENSLADAVAVGVIAVGGETEQDAIYVQRAGRDEVARTVVSVGDLVAERVGLLDEATV